MLRRYTTAVVLAVGSALGACSAQGPGGVAYETRSEPKSTATGVTSSGEGGAISGGTSGGEKKEQRGNTPPGTSRDGQGPAAGAIVDPTGAVTRGK